MENEIKDAVKEKRSELDQLEAAIAEASSQVAPEDAPEVIEAQERLAATKKRLTEQEVADSIGIPVSLFEGFKWDTRKDLEKKALVLKSAIGDVKTSKTEDRGKALVDFIKG